jgi:predicted PurR-regulated permease PerM
MAAQRMILSRPAAVTGPELPASAFEMTVIAFLIVIALYVGQVVLVPLALAVILAFVLAPAVRLLRRAGLANTPSVFLTVAVAFAIIFGVGALITQQVSSLVEELPRYQLTLRDKVKALKDVAEGSGGAIKQASETLKDLQQELEDPKPPATSVPSINVVPPRDSTARPIPVEVRNPAPTPLDQLQRIIGIVIEPLATAGLVVLFVLFLLLQREDVRDRAIRLLGSNDLEKSTVAMDDAGDRLSRYFLTLTAINAAYGVFIAAGLWAIGVPSPVLWGVLAALMRFVPFLGSFIAAAFPLLLAAAVDPGWGMFLWTLALYLLTEPLMGNVIEPVVQGQRTGLSPLAIVLSAAFWTLLWGPIGLLLAIPLTVVLVVLGHHVERLEFLNVLLGDTPPLSPAERFYQRMLAGDPAEAVEQAEAVLKEKPLVDYYDEVVIEGLRLAQTDADRGTLEPERLVDIRDIAEVVVETLADFRPRPQQDAKPAKSLIEDAEDAQLAPAAPPPPRPAEKAADEADEEDEDDLDLCNIGAPLDPAWRSDNAILCVASRTALDETAAMAFAQLVGKCGLGVKVLDVAQLRHGALASEDASGVRLICISALDVRERSAHARFLVRRLKRSAPQALLLGGFWKLDPEAEHDKSILASIPVDATAHSLREAVTFTLKTASTPPDEERTGRSRDRVEVRAAS